MSVISGTVGAIMGAEATKSAAKTQADAARYAADLQQKQYEQTREDMAPWREAGKEALGQMRDLSQLGSYYQQDFSRADFEADPGYQFRLSEGMKAIERSAAARGSLLSGRTLKDLQRFGQDTASAEFQNAYNRFQQNRTARFNRLASLAGIGQTATNQTALFGANAAGNMAEAAYQGANARASGYIGQANAMGGALSSLSQLPSTIKAYQNLFGGRTGGNVVSPYPVATTPSPTFQGSGTTATLAYTGSAAQAADAAAAADYLAYF